ncbi:hypothetical protein [Emticicia fontis]
MSDKQTRTPEQESNTYAIKQAENIYFVVKEMIGPVQLPYGKTVVYRTKIS